MKRLLNLWLALSVVASGACIRAELDDDEGDGDAEQHSGVSPPLPGQAAGTAAPAPAKCRSAFECGAGKTCNPSTGACDPIACTSEAQCDFNTFCHTASQQCVVCSATNCEGVCSRGKCVECTDNSQCAPTQECYIDERCHDRCYNNDGCPTGSICSAVPGTCSDPVGKPCVKTGLSCHGGSCTDVDANLRTVAPYCTVYCGISAFNCPSGYTCKNYDCVKL